MTTKTTIRMKYKTWTSGFSLIELLVVISILGILIGLSAFGLQQARESARDGQRKVDLETLRTGLSMYKSDCNKYPTLSGSLPSPFVGLVADCGTLNNTYIDETPTDPVSGNYYVYDTTDGGKTYRICACLETETQTAISDCSGLACGGPCNYVVKNP